MKYLIVLLALNLCSSSLSQSKNDDTEVFIRIYDLEGKKIYKGSVVSVSDSKLQISRSAEKIDIPVNSIGKIKTKRSSGHNVLVGTGIGSATFALLGALPNDDGGFVSGGYSSGEGFAVGTIIGAPFGAAIGGITALFKKSETFIINGNEAKWREFMNHLNN